MQSSTSSSAAAANSDASAHSDQPLFARESAAVGSIIPSVIAGGGGTGSVMSIDASRASQRRPRSIVLDRVSKAGSLARASVDLARDLAREFVEPPTQHSQLLTPSSTSQLVHRHVSSAGNEVGDAKAAAGAVGVAAAADLEGGDDGGDKGGDGSHTKQHGRGRVLTPLELESMPKGTCEDGVRRRGNTFRYFLFSCSLLRSTLLLLLLLLRRRQRRSSPPSFSFFFLLSLS